MTRRETKVLANLLYDFYPISNINAIWKACRSEEGFQISHPYSIHYETFGCTIWKDTDITVDPQWKGEPLVIYIPMWEDYACNKRKMRKLLRQLHWIYY